MGFKAYLFLGYCRWVGLVGRIKMAWFRFIVPIRMFWRRLVIFNRIKPRDGETPEELRSRAIRIYIRWCDLESIRLDRDLEKSRRQYKAMVHEGAARHGMTPEEYEDFIDSVTR